MANDTLVIRGPARGLRGTVRVPGDKSIAHRAALLAALCEGESVIRGFPAAGDPLSTLRCLASLGVSIQASRPATADLFSSFGPGRPGTAEPSAGADPGPLEIRINGAGLRGLKEPDSILDVGNSGTTLRMLLGILAGQPLFAVLSGDASIRRRPMSRVAGPLRAMGASIDGRAGGERAPLAVRGGAIRGFRHELPVASAQVKSAILLAGLNASGETEVTEPALSRDHTERMLTGLGIEVWRRGTTVTVSGPASSPRAHSVEIPGDLSSAAFLAVAAAIVPGSEVIVEGVGINPTRSGALDVLSAMGAGIEALNKRDAGGEPVADLLIRPPVSGGTGLRALEIEGELTVRAIDEIPVLAVAACAAGGETVIRDAAELRVKESDRITGVVDGLAAMGADISPAPDGMIIRGGKRLRGARVDSLGDHRLAMALAVAGLIADGETVIAGAGCAAISFPGFRESLQALGADISGD